MNPNMDATLQRQPVDTQAGPDHRLCPRLETRLYLNMISEPHGGKWRCTIVDLPHWLVGWLAFLQRPKPCQVTLAEVLLGQPWLVGAPLTGSKTRVDLELWVRTCTWVLKRVLLRILLLTINTVTILNISVTNP